ncbi:MAG: glycosyltransferase, partial [Candidatus Binatia bacterium]
MSDEGPAARIVCFSAYRGNLRATALIRLFRQAGYQIILPKPHGPSSSILELILTFLPNCWLALTCRADLAAGFKPQPNVSLPLLICKLRGIPTWIDVDDLDHAYRSGLLSRLVELYEKPFPRLFTMISYHNRRLRDYLVGPMHCAPERLFCIPQGVDYELFAQSYQPASVSGVNGKPVAIYAAHLNVASDLEPVLQAWQIVAKKVTDCVLLIIGGGPLLGHFRKMAVEMGLAGRVQFTGEIAHADVPRHFAWGEIALLYMTPRLVNEYRCSLKLREYFAAGLKVVSNDVGELSEYAHLIYQTGSGLGEFAAMIVRVLDGFDDGRQKVAQEFVREQLDWPQI